MHTVMAHPAIRRLVLLALGIAVLLSGAAARAAEGSEPDDQVVAAFLALLSEDPAQAAAGLTYVSEHWREGYVAMTVETLRLVRNPLASAALLQALELRTGLGFGYETHRWQEWQWSQDPPEHPRYAQFKAALYGLIDQRFAGYFASGRPAAIRLDEVVWGGVVQDGIPPLREPAMIPVSEAAYLEDDHVIFGISVNGDARAYPKRILGWHEMFVDVVGGVPVAGVYCTLCGTVILYETEHAGVSHALGTSGFLYRSNKLMYDQATQSLWSTMRGTPVVGPLVGREISLARRAVVTTTWGEWRRRHPDTTVLSLETGHQRDYSEGAAYRDYFATDELMFAVPRRDGRLANKAEILGLLLAAHPDRPLAISAEYLAEHPVHHDRVGEIELVVLTDESGANRAYESGGVVFASYDGDRTVMDTEGGEWRLDESGLTGPDGRRLARLPAQRAFWFGWFSAFSHSRLVH